MDDQRTDREGGGSVIVSKAFNGIVAILFAANFGCGTKPLPPAAPHKQPAVAAENAITPEEITSITLTRLGGPGFMDKEPVHLVRTKETDYYFHRLAKALTDNGFWKLNDVYPGRGFDGPGIKITLTRGSKEKTVVNSDYGTETDPTYLFEMLIRGADADMKARLGRQ